MSDEVAAAISQVAVALETGLAQVAQAIIEASGRDHGEYGFLGEIDRSLGRVGEALKSIANTMEETRRAGERS